METFLFFIAGLDLGEAQQFEITRSKPHGHVAAVLGTLRKVGLERIIHSRQRRERDLVVAMIVARIVEPGSKLATARGLSKQTLTSSLGECVGVEDTNEDELYDSLDWLLSRQAAIEKKLAKRHLQQGSLVLYDLTSTWVEGRSCPLAKVSSGSAHFVPLRFSDLQKTECCSLLCSMNST